MLQATTYSMLGPGIALMRRLHVPLKMGLMGLLLALPLGLLLHHSWRTGSETLRVTERSASGATAVNGLVELVIRTQVHRGLGHRASFGDEAAKQQLAEAAQALRNAVQASDATSSTSEWPRIRAQLLELADGKGPARRDERFALHTQLIDGIAQELIWVAEHSGMLFDPRPDSHFMIDQMVRGTIPWLEALAVVRGQGSALLARGDASGNERALVLGQANAIRRQLADVEQRLTALRRAGVAAPAAWPAARDASNALATMAGEVFGADALVGEPGPFFDRATAAINAALAVQRDVSGMLVATLQSRLNQQRRAMWTEFTIAAIGVLSVAYLALAFYASFAGALRALVNGVRQVADGDLSHRIEIRGNDEMAQIGAHVDRMNERLSALVSQIRNSAIRVSQSGSRVADGSRALASRTEEQAGTLRLTVGAVKELSGAVSSNASQAAELDRLTARLRVEAEDGGRAMNDSLQAMSGLEAGSRRVAEIVGVIDGIAFQTNILALNAAVEAARAGESGRGFAVVAAEVRQLAQRSSAAAAEIRDLIEQSADQVKSSVAQTQHVGQALASLVEGVRSVSGSLQGIASASAQQSARLIEVSQAVGSLDEITQSNAHMVEDSGEAAQDLVGRAQALSGAVASIRLRHGSADEALALVQRARSLVQARGLADATAALHSAEQGFVDRDLYVFVVDRQGVYRLHGARREMEGRRVHEVPGMDGDRFVRDAWAAAEQPGGGWVEYEILNPETGQVQPKASFVMALDKQCLVGCGVYRYEVTA